MLPIGSEGKRVLPPPSMSGLQLQNTHAVYCLSYLHRALTPRLKLLTTTDKSTAREGKGTEKKVIVEHAPPPLSTAAFKMMERGFGEQSSCCYPCC